MRALKILVVVMGVLLVLGTVGLAIGIAIKVKNRQVAAGPPQTMIDLPPGAEIASSEIAGDRLVLRLHLADGSARILIVDLRNASLIGTVELKRTLDKP